jgi:hypothetical protein
MSSHSDWRRLLLKRFRGWAQKKFPVPFPLRCYLKHPSKMPDMLGYFEFNEDENRGVICIANTCGADSFLDTLCEEWAHARTAYLCTDDEDPHTASFWAEYGRIVSASRDVHW